MSDIDDLPVNQAIELYYAKHHALRHADMMTLIAMKKQHPDIFTKEKDEQICNMIQYAKQFEKSARYAELHKMMMKEMLTIIPHKPEHG